jgi:hypothetical protein
MDTEQWIAICILLLVIGVFTGNKLTQDAMLTAIENGNIYTRCKEWNKTTYPVQSTETTIWQQEWQTYSKNLTKSIQQTKK